jgi:uncharacterized protein (TIGR02444 family)
MSAPMAAGTPQNFWNFSLDLYGRPGVAPALLGLQDALGLDVNMLVLCCWAASRGRALAAADLDAVVAVAEPWQTEVVVPLRALRRRLKGGFPPLPPDRVETYRKGFSDLEIEGEHIAQEAMERVIDTLPKSAPARADAALTVANLRAYLAHQQKEIGPAESKALNTILQGCYPEEKGIHEFSQKG